MNNAYDRTYYTYRIIYTQYPIIPPSTTYISFVFIGHHTRGSKQIATGDQGEARRTTVSCLGREEKENSKDVFGFIFLTVVCFFCLFGSILEARGFLMGSFWVLGFLLSNLL